jgi:hypothetical protein
MSREDWERMNREDWERMIREDWERMDRKRLRKERVEKIEKEVWPIIDLIPFVCDKLFGKKTNSIFSSKPKNGLWMEVLLQLVPVFHLIASNAHWHYWKNK